MSKMKSKTPDLKHLDKSLRVAPLDVKGRDRVAPPVAAADRPGLVTLLRLGGWGFGMALALGLTVAVARTDRGIERIEQVFAGLQKPVRPAVPTQVVQTPPDPTTEARRLAAQIEALKADREKLLVRMTALEQNLDDVTGSVKQTVQRIVAARETSDDNDDGPAVPVANDSRESEPLRLTGTSESGSPRAAVRELIPLPRTAPMPSTPAVASGGGALPVPLVMHPTVVAATTVGVPASLSPAVQTGAAPDEVAHRPVTRPANAASLARLETAKTAPHETPPRLAYGIDLGGAGTIDALRALWAATKAEHAPQLDSLQPAVVLRPTGKGGAPQLRLMAGPFADAGAAAALCKTFVAGRGTCRPFAFDGQKLPLH
jgi:hypothetical protein